METKTFAPEGWHTITPRLVVSDVELFVNFLRQVFGATGDYQTDRPTIMTIGDSMLMISESGIRKMSPAFLYVYVADVDRTYELAISAGATSLEAPLETPYGDRRCMIEDQWGNVWQIATFGK